MTLSIGPEMKFFRWILSHLTIIVVFFVVLYLYFSYYAFKPDSDKTDSATNSAVRTTKPQPEDKQNPNNSHLNSITEKPQETVSHLNSQTVEKMPVSNGFSQRQEEYRRRLSVEEQKAMDQAATVFEQRSQTALKVPAKKLAQSYVIDDSINSEELAAKDPVLELQEIRYPSDEFQTTKSKENSIDNDVDNYANNSIDNSNDNYANYSVEKHIERPVDENNTAFFSPKQIEAPDKLRVEAEAEAEAVAQIISNKPVQKMTDEAPAQILSEVTTQDESETFTRQKTEVPVQIIRKTLDQAKMNMPVQAKSEAVSGIRPEAELAEDNSLPAQQERPDVGDKNLQQQIRHRQKQLQEQMIQLIPLNTHKKVAANIAENPIKSQLFRPLVSTDEQQQLLYDARQAFDSHEFDDAERKYSQLINQLPEIPDVVGELANVFKTQHKTSEYLRANTLFVKRLVAQNRFNEAWRVVSMTDKIDKKTANKQRKMIRHKQKELPEINKNQ